MSRVQSCSYVELVFFMGDNKDRIRQLYSKIPFAANRQSENSRNLADEAEKGTPDSPAGDVGKPSDSKAKVDSQGVKDKPKDAVNSKMQDDTKDKKMKTDDDAEVLSDLVIFKKHTNDIADLLDVPQFKRFRIRERISEIDYSAVEQRFK